MPPTPNIVAEKPTSAPTPTDGNENNAYRSIKVQLYAIDYTLSQTDRTPIKLDFLELQTVTASYFKDYMIKAYEVSTQATLVDFTTVFVTAHFTPGYPYTSSTTRQHILAQIQLIFLRRKLYLLFLKNPWTILNFTLMS